VASGEATPLVSVVVPVYNTAPYLAECLQSILAQTWTHWECIVVDNCSTDGGLAIARQFGAADSRFRIIAADKFRGQAANFNFALSHLDPASRYTKMVLSDDWIFPDCLRQMVAVAGEHPSVGLVSGYMVAGPRVICQGMTYPLTMAAGRDVVRQHFLSGSQVFGSQTSVMYRSDLVRNLTPFFNEQSLVNDREVCLRILREADFGFVHQVVSFSRTDNQSITSGILSFNPYALHTLILLHQYGREVLSPAEFEEVWDRIATGYFHYLGEQVIRRREPAFWAYHARGLEQIGRPLTSMSRMKLALGVIPELVGNPRSTWRRLTGR